jgi:hypothetical protein
MMKEVAWDGVSQFYKDPLPKRRKKLKLLYEQLVQRLSTSMPGSRDYELIKEKIAQLLRQLEKQWNMKDYVFLAVGIIGTVVGILGFIL